MYLTTTTTTAAVTTEFEHHIKNLHIERNRGK